MMRKLQYWIFAVLTALSVASTGCISDDFTTSSSDVLAFSADTVAFDTVITAQSTPTKQFMVYNRSKKMINISSIKVAGNGRGRFYINVDGMKGSEFHDVEVRGQDSIYVMVESNIDVTGTDEPVEATDRIDFVTNGVTQSVALTAWGQDVNIVKGDTIKADTRLRAGKPYLVYDTLVVAQGATLTLDPGVTMLFHAKAGMKVEGRLDARGTQEQPIALRGDRLDHVVGQINFDIMSGQWGGVRFGRHSYGNEMAYVEMRGSAIGVEVKPESADRMALHLFNSVLHNSSSSVLSATGAWVEAEGTELSDAAGSVASFEGGKVRLVQCTLANYYLFDAISGPILNLVTDNDSLPALDAHVDNCIIYGNASELASGDYSGTNVLLRNCLLKSKGSDDANFINCVWGGDPKFYTVREKYVFDYRLKNESDAIAAGDRSLCPASARYDRYGQDRWQREGIDLGAYVWVQATDDDNKTQAAPRRLLR